MFKEMGILLNPNKAKGSKTNSNNTYKAKRYAKENKWAS